MFTRGIASQFVASLEMLKNCIDRCPDRHWNEAHNDYPFSQVVFHTLFDCDYCLSADDGDLKNQLFHRLNQETFGEYEEIGDSRSRRLYGREFIVGYYEHCRGKITTAVEADNSESILMPNSDVYRNMSKLERHINAIRHIQHHASQLGLRLQFLTGKEMDWISRGYD